MSTTTATESPEVQDNINPGASLASIREEKGYSVSFVAEKLHLRVRIIELLEADDYQGMPEPVFIKGYLRAYANLLEVNPAPYIEAYNSHHDSVRRMEKSLWQSRREPQKAERMVKWMTILLTAFVVLALSVWWHANKDNERFFRKHVSNDDVIEKYTESDIRLTDLSKMRSLLSNKVDDLSMVGNSG